MRTRVLMGASAVFLGVLGVVALFGPDEILRAAAIPASPLLPPFVQLLGALLLGFAMMNWMAKGSRVGGIYNRPIAIANLVHFAVGAITLDRFALRGHEAWPVIAFAAIYTLFALGFGVVVFGRSAA